MKNLLQGLLSYLKILCLTNLIESLYGVLLLNFLKLESSASWNESWYDIGDVVANETESCCPWVLLHHSSQGCLGIFSHGISLIKNDELKLILIWVLQRRRWLCKLFDLISNHSYASVIGGIEFQDHVSKDTLVYLFGTCQNSRGLSSARRTIHDYVREILLIHIGLKSVNDLLVWNKIIHVSWSVFFDPWTWAYLWLVYLKHYKLYC